MSLTNNYIRLVLYALISAVIFIMASLLMNFARAVSVELYLPFAYIVLILQVLADYLILALFNILFLNKIYFESTLSWSNEFKSYAYYSILYLISTSIILKSAEIIYPILIGASSLNPLKDFLSILVSFVSIFNFIYIIVFPYLYIKYQKILQKMRWF